MARNHSRRAEAGRQEVGNKGHRGGGGKGGKGGGAAKGAGKGGGGAKGAGKGGGAKGGKAQGNWVFVPQASPKQHQRPVPTSLPPRGKGSHGKGKVINWMTNHKVAQKMPQQKGKGKGPSVKKQVHQMPVKKVKGKGKGGSVQQVVQKTHVKKGKGKAKGFAQKVMQHGKGKGRVQQVVQKMHVKKGKGKAKGGFAQKVVQKMAIKKGKGKGKGKVANEQLDKLQPLDASVKIWVAGLDENVSWKKVAQHFKEIGKAKVALMKSGKACVAFETADEADNAIASLNGSDMGGKTIEVDVWTQREKTEREPREKKPKDKKKKLVKAGFAAKVAIKGKKSDTGPVVSKFWEKLKAMDISLKVKVTNLGEDATCKMLMDHFKDLGAKCSVADIMVKAKGTACLGFPTADDAESAIAAVGGSDLGGQTLEVVPWPERTHEKKSKKSDE